MTITSDYFIKTSIEIISGTYGNDMMNRIAIFTEETPLTNLYNSFGNADFKVYSSSEGVAKDFATDSFTLKLAQIAFNQKPCFGERKGALIIIPLKGAKLKTKLLTLKADANFYGFTTTDTTLKDTDILDISTTVQGMKSVGTFYYGLSTEDDDYNTIADSIVSQQNTRTRLFVHTDKQESICVAMGNCAQLHSIDYGITKGITMNKRVLPSVQGDKTINNDTMTQFVEKGLDAYCVQDNIGIMCTSGKNQFSDTIYEVDVVKTNVDRAINSFTSSAGKLTYTDVSMTKITDVIRKELDKGVTSGIIAKGTWDSSEYIGNDREKFHTSIENFGYYIYFTPVAFATPEMRKKRESVPIQIAFKHGGAIHFFIQYITVEI